MSSKNILFLFAPKFRDFGVDIIKRMLILEPNLMVAGICMGGARVYDFVKMSLPEKNVYKLWDIEALEHDWINQETISIDILARIDVELGPGACGEVITADRRIGRGYVRGGICRPDDLGDLVDKDPVTVPIKYLQGSYLFTDEVFIKFKPDLVFCYAVASAPAVMLGLMSKSRNVKFLRLSPSRIGRSTILDEDFKGRLSCVAETINENLDAESLIQAKAYLESYRQKPTQPEYVNYTTNLLKTSGFISIFLEAAKMSLILCWDYFLTKRSKRVSSIQFKRKVFELITEVKRKNFPINLFDNSLPSLKYIYFPLHVDPEASTMVLSHMHTDQISVIEALSKSLPGDTVLVVKEHHPMLGKRPNNFYETIKKIPRVKLINPSYDSLTLIVKSEAVATITGTASFEAILLKKKTLIIGTPPALMINEGFIHEPSLSNLPVALAKLNEVMPAKDESLIKFLASIFYNSFDMDTSILWGNYHKYDDNKKKDTIGIISTKVLYHLDSYNSNQC